EGRPDDQLTLPDSAGIALRPTAGLTVEAVTVEGSALLASNRYGLLAQPAPPAGSGEIVNLTITGGVMARTNSRSGFLLSGMRRSLVSGNHLVDNGEAGIAIECSSDNNLV